MWEVGREKEDEWKMNKRWLVALAGALLLLVAGGTAAGVAAATRSSAADQASQGASPPQAATQQAADKPWLGAVVVPMPDGATIAAVIADSPADAAGLRRGDIIKALDGVAIADLKGLREQLQGKAVGDTVTLTIDRGGQTLSLAVTLGQRPPSLVQRPQPPAEGLQPPAERPKPFPELEGIPKDQLFGHILGGQLNLTDAAGNPLTVTIALGTVTAKSEDSLTVALNAGGEKTYRITDNTVGRLLLSSRLEAGAKVTVVTVGASNEARLVVPGGRGLSLPGIGGLGHHKQAGRGHHPFGGGVLPGRAPMPQGQAQ